MADSQARGFAFRFWAAGPLFKSGLVPFGPKGFIPIRKEDLFSALIKQDDLADPVERELFWRFARTLRTICHYEYSETLDRLRDDYYYFNPEVAGHTAADRAKSDCAYDDLIRSLGKVLKDANFEELPHEEVREAIANARYRSKLRQSTMISARYVFTSAAAMSNGLK